MIAAILILAGLIAGAAAYIVLRSAEQDFNAEGY